MTLRIATLEPHHLNDDDASRDPLAAVVAEQSRDCEEKEEEEDDNVEGNEEYHGWEMGEAMAIMVRYESFAQEMVVRSISWSRAQDHERPKLVSFLVCVWWGGGGGSTPIRQTGSGGRTRRSFVDSAQSSITVFIVKRILRTVLCSRFFDFFLGVEGVCRRTQVHLCENLFVLRAALGGKPARDVNAAVH